MPASRTMLTAVALGVASLAFAGGFAVSSATAASPPPPPIVDVNAWEKTATASDVVDAMPVRLAPLEPALQATLQCNPWDVSDVAMEEILRELKRQGWRQPSQGAAVASMISMGVEGISAVDPSAPMPSESNVSMITVLTDEEAEQLRNEQISLEQLITDDPVMRTPS